MKKTNATPYLSVAITNACNFRCTYCSPDQHGGVGEGFGTPSCKTDIEDLCKKLSKAEGVGVKRIRITGGEPLIVKGIMEVLHHLENETQLEYALATNGSLVHRFIEDFRKLSRLDLRISLDSLFSDQFQSICQVKKKVYEQTMKNIKNLADEKLLNRVAMVVTKENVDEVEALLDFCDTYQLNLKLFDMYATTETKESWNSMYSPLNQAKEIVEKNSESISQIPYTKNFGIPSKEYNLKNGKKVRIKDSIAGTTYHKEYCNSCPSYPCQEGLYTILYSSNQKLIPCRLSHTHFEAGSIENFGKNLKHLIDIFQSSELSNDFWR